MVTLESAAKTKKIAVHSVSECGCLLVFIHALIFICIVRMCAWAQYPCPASNGGG